MFSTAFHTETRGNRRTIFLLWIVIILTSAPPAFADMIFTSEAAFLNYVQPGYYLEDFNSLPLPPQPIATPSDFNQNGFFYSITASGGLFSGQESAAIANPDLSTTFPGVPILINFTGKTVMAVGGLFFPSNVSGFDSLNSGIIRVSINNGSFTDLTYSGPPRQFLGFVSDAPITTLLIATGQDADYWATVDHLYVGQTAVPISPSILLFASGLLGLMGWRMKNP